VDFNILFRDLGSLFFLREEKIKRQTIIDSSVRPREAPPLKAGKKARLRVNLEQTPAFRPGSRKVHSAPNDANGDRREGEGL
jgi:hypothetical protein